MEYTGQEMLRVMVKAVTHKIAVAVLIFPAQHGAEVLVKLT